jgi:amino acid adenylation domain-containing protein
VSETAERNSGVKGAGVHAPLSFGQERLWLTHLLEPDSPVYNMPICLELRGKLDVSALERSLTEILRRHEILRTSIVIREGEPRQQVVPHCPVTLDVVDLSGQPASERKTQALECASREGRRPFHLETGVVLRASLFRIDEEEHILLIVIHHIVFDGWSLTVFLRELKFFYDGFTRGITPVLSPLSMQYSEFAAWQRDYANSKVMREHLAYWHDHLGEKPPVLDLRADRQRPKVRSSKGGTVHFRVPAAMTDRARQLGKGTGATLYMTLLSAFVAQLHHYTGQDEILIGTPVAGRTRSDTEDLIGFFVNTLALRIRIVEDPGFRELLRRVRSLVISGLAHQDAPFEKLATQKDISRDMGWTPLFQVLFVLQTATTHIREMAGLEVSVSELDTKTSKFDLTLVLSETEDGLAGDLEYSSDLFDEETIRRMAGHYVELLEGAVNDPDVRVSELPMLSERERRQILEEWNATEREYPRDRCIHELFEEQVKRSPGRVALVCGEERLTYEELNRRANRLAHRLQKEGVEGDVLVGLCMDRSLEMVVGIVGILKAGGAYLPLDPRYPQERLRFMVADARPKVIVAQKETLSVLSGFAVPVVSVDGDTHASTLEATRDPISRSGPDNLAYVIYTSGSTGEPKGVLVSHDNVVRLFRSTEELFHFGPDDTWTLFHSFAFDFSVWEIWGALLYGGRLVIVPYDVSRATDQFYDLLVAHKVTVLNQTPSAFLQLDRYEDSLRRSTRTPLRLVIFGGEALDVRALTHWFQRHGDRHPQLVNMYGITETTVHVTYKPLSAADVDSPGRIGVPLKDLQVYILDSGMELVPVGVPGEICVAGGGVARGYLNRNELESEKFIPNPFARNASARLYRSGDRGRLLANGEIEYLGRLDDQVKIRGFRVEPGEIESHLLKSDGVAAVKVIVHEDDTGDKRLVAYCVIHPTSTVSPATLRHDLAAVLPDYMLPSAFIFIDRMPLTLNGKVDRSALPEPVFGEGDLKGSFDPPRDLLEMMIASSWNKLFGRSAIGLRDNFFELGGHSLMAFRFFAELEQSTGVQLPLATLFEAPTIEQLATIVRQKGWEPPWSCLVPMKAGGSRLPMYFIHGVGGNVLSFHDLAHQLAPDQPVYGLQSLGLDGKHAPLVRVEDMASQYVSEIRLLQPSGPYCLGGLSFGGAVAYEMARQLAASGETVGLLALLDTYARPDSITRAQIIRDYVIMLGRRSRWHMEHLLKLSTSERIEYIRTSITNFKRKIWNRYWEVTFDREPRAQPTMTDALRDVTEGNYVAARKFRAHPYSGSVTLFRAEYQGLEGLSDPVEEWKSLATGGVHVITVPGDHVTMLNEPNVGVLAKRLDECLANVKR